MRVLAFLGFGWSKWTTVAENVIRHQETTNPILGVISSGPVMVDILKKTNRLTGGIKYKNVIR